jgi:uncharacterized protein YndB with AHSA1/START domain
MAVDVTVETRIERPVEDVAAFAGDPGNAPSWYVNIESLHWRTPPPVPGERLVMRTAQGPFPMQTTYTWEPADGGTRMTLRNNGSPSGFARATARVMELAMRRTMTKDLAALKRRLEA